MKINLPDQWTSEQLTLLQHAPRPVEIIKGVELPLLNRTLQVLQ